MPGLTAAVICPTQDPQRAVMAARDRALRGRVRQALVRPVPLVSAIAGLLGLASACLNPHPDEEPTFFEPRTPGDQGKIDVVAPATETCADNPLLAGCSSSSSGAPQPTGSGAGGSANTGAGGSASTGAGGSAGVVGSAGAAGSAGVAGSGELDAGERDAGPVDAGPGAVDAG
jgi:hypothetical protein